MYLTIFNYIEILCCEDRGGVQIDRAVQRHGRYVHLLATNGIDDPGIDKLSGF